MDKLQIRSDLDNKTWKMLDFIKKWLNTNNNTATVKFCIKQTNTVIISGKSILIVNKENSVTTDDSKQKQLRVDLDKNSIEMLEIIKNWLNTTYNTEAVKFAIKRTYEMLEDGDLSIIKEY